MGNLGFDPRHSPWLCKFTHIERVSSFSTAPRFEAPTQVTGASPERILTPPLPETAVASCSAEEL
jgi:hypothetical protein